MSKEFDVHFNIVFSDMICGIEATSKSEAKEKAIEILRSQVESRITYLLENDFDLEENTMITDVLEVGKDI